MQLANTTNLILGTGTVIIQIASLLLLVMILTKDRGNLAKWFADKSLVLVVLIMGGSMLASLFYSEIIGYVPCLLCWYQRLAIFAIAIISFIALIKKHGKEVWSYISTFSVLGIIVAVLHVFSRSTNSEIFDCSAVGPSCLQELFKVYGYIDIPVMSLTALFFVVLVIINRKKFY
jgi:disulfide bond formation protein DsbB